MALQLGGAPGNLVDRVAFEGATGFLQFGSAVLNVADLALVARAKIGTVTRPLRSAALRRMGRRCNPMMTIRRLVAALTPVAVLAAIAPRLRSGRARGLGERHFRGLVTG